MSVDTACSSGLTALCGAVAAIKDGRCDAALVGATSVLLKPQSSVTMNKLGLLSADGACKAFDETGMTRDLNRKMCLSYKLRTCSKVKQSKIPSMETGERVLQNWKLHEAATGWCLNLYAVLS